jgi:hypothetical protein
MINAKEEAKHFRANSEGQVSGNDKVFCQLALARFVTGLKRGILGG